MLVARSKIDMPGGARMCGQPIPEARTWRRLQPWLRRRKIIEVPDDLWAVLCSDDIAALLKTGDFDEVITALIDFERALLKRNDVLDAFYARQAIVLKAKADAKAKAEAAEATGDGEPVDLADLRLALTGSIGDLRDALATGELDAHLVALDALETDSKDRVGAHGAIKDRSESLAEAA